MDRFLYRLSKSRFVLKGALTLRVWDALMARPTKERPGAVSDRDPRRLWRRHRGMEAFSGWQRILLAVHSAARSHHRAIPERRQSVAVARL